MLVSHDAKQVVQRCQRRQLLVTAVVGQLELYVVWCTTCARHLLVPPDVDEAVYKNVSDYKTLLPGGLSWCNLMYGNIGAKSMLIQYCKQAAYAKRTLQKASCLGLD